MTGDARSVPNLRLLALESAVREARAALDDVAPDGFVPTRATAASLQTAWVSGPAGAAIAGIDEQGRRLRDGFAEALETLQRLLARELDERTVPADDPRGDPALYPFVDAGGPR